MVSALLYQAFYRIGFTPWDGHALSSTLRKLIEGPAALPAGAAIDIGCGTGDSSIYLGRHGWQVTGVDVAAKALEKAGAKAAAGHVRVHFLRADATRLSSAGLGKGCTLILDSGCLHGMSDDARDRYVAELGAIAAPQTHLLIFAFTPGGQTGVRGVDHAEIERRFTPQWELVSAADEDEMTNNPQHPARHYLLQRRA
ncbi:class I SAM-dependent methyltransferase [Mycobacterium sp.]|uniref:class I SAM-dependent methyltransferase n=1 Tax=Mycobacterium sp. TaxID=1785 RepID=UPI003C73275C